MWIYNPVKKQYKEIEVNEITEEDRDNFKKNILAFASNKYISGIENSLCGFCYTEYGDYEQK